MDIELLNIGPQAGFILLTLCAGGTKLVDELIPVKFNGAAKIIISVLIGAAASYALDGVTVLAGIAYGLSTSGLITAIGYTKKTTPVEQVVG